MCNAMAGHNSAFCNPCRHQNYYNRDPVRVVYTKLKSNAKRRGHKFTLTLKYFRHFCKLTNYIELRGRNKEAYSIDRIDSTKGYQKGNLQILTVSENSRKQDNPLYIAPSNENIF